MIDLAVYLPDPSATSVEDLAAMFVEQQERLKSIVNWYYAVRRQLQESVPIKLPDGRTLLAEGSEWEYPDAIAETFPELASFVVAAAMPTTASADRLESLIEEEFAGFKVGVKRSVKVDGRMVRKVIDAGGDKAKELLDLRKRKTPDLVVK